MRTLLAVVGAALVWTGAASAEQGRRPIVVELFTSQGCSSCPPADQIVAELAQRRPDLLPLTFHVTYWNRLGWQDPFSFAGATERQRQYVARSISPDVYTPALIIDGRTDVVGSDPNAVAVALQRAVAAPRQTVDMGLMRAGQTLTASVAPGQGAASVLLIGYDRQHRTAVSRGENGGRTLVEANIVRSMTTLGRWTGQGIQFQSSVPEGEEFAVLLQSDDGHIIGARRLEPAVRS